MNQNSQFLWGTILSIALLAARATVAQPAAAQSPASIIPFDNPRWQITGREVIKEPFLGKPSLKLTGGNATLADAHFTNGVITFDIAVQHARYFPGIGFRMQDPGDGERFYLRPHQSGNPDATQYYPEYNGDGAWQLYYGDGFNHAQVLPFDQWIHVRMVIEDSRAAIYFDGVLVLSPALLRPTKAGMIVLDNSDPVSVHYADFSYQATDTATLPPAPAPRAALPAEMVRTWEVSAPFDETGIKDKPMLHSQDTSGLSWQLLDVDDRGIADLSRLAGTAPGKNTVFARKTLWADGDEIRKISFGFSDRVKVFLNGRLLYAGADEFMSRDYRFLGTVGFFDALYLPLHKGVNELYIAVSEDFGGWGLTAKILPLSGQP
jgi:hypothetical protein